MVSGMWVSLGQLLRTIEGPSHLLDCRTTIIVSDRYDSCATYTIVLQMNNRAKTQQ